MNTFHTPFIQFMQVNRMRDHGLWYWINITILTLVLLSIEWTIKSLLLPIPIPVLILKKFSELSFQTHLQKMSMQLQDYLQLDSDWNFNGCNY